MFGIRRFITIIQTPLIPIAIGFIVLFSLGFKNDRLWNDEQIYLTNALVLSGKAAKDTFPYTFYPGRQFFYTLLAGLFWLGFPIWVSKLVSPAFGVAAVAFMYLLGRSLFNSKTGFYASLFLSLNWYFWYCTAQILTDTPGLAFLLAAMYFLFEGVEKSKRIHILLSGLVGGLSVFMRDNNILFLFIYFAYLTLTKRFNWVREKYTAISALMILFLVGTYLLLFEGFFEVLSHRALLSNLPSPISPGGKLYQSAWDVRVYWLIRIPYYLSLTACIAGAYGLLSSVGDRNLKKSNLLLMLFAVPYLLILLSLNYYEDRFFLPLVPIVFLYAGLAFERLEPRKHLFILCLLLTCFSLIVARPFPYRIIWGWDHVNWQNTGNDFEQIVSKILIR